MKEKELTIKPIAASLVLNILFLFSIIKHFYFFSRDIEEIESPLGKALSETSK